MTEQPISGAVRVQLFPSRIVCSLIDFSLHALVDIYIVVEWVTDEYEIESIPVINDTLTLRKTSPLFRGFVPWAKKEARSVKNVLHTWEASAEQLFQRMNLPRNRTPYLPRNGTSELPRIRSCVESHFGCRDSESGEGDVSRNYNLDDLDRSTAAGGTKSRAVDASHSLRKD
jgi:hypothetical protein